MVEASQPTLGASLPGHRHPRVGQVLQQKITPKTRNIINVLYVLLDLLNGLYILFPAPVNRHLTLIVKFHDGHRWGDRGKSWDATGGGGGGFSDSSHNPNPEVYTSFGTRWAHKPGSVTQEEGQQSSTTFVLCWYTVRNNCSIVSVGIINPCCQLVGKTDVSTEAVRDSGESLPLYFPKIKAIQVSAGTESLSFLFSEKSRSSLSRVTPFYF